MECEQTSGKNKKVDFFFLKQMKLNHEPAGQETYSYKPLITYIQTPGSPCSDISSVFFAPPHPHSLKRSDQSRSDDTNMSFTHSDNQWEKLCA